MSTQQTRTNNSKQDNTGAQGEHSIWRQVLGDQAYHRAIRKEHSARYRHPCPWCGFESTTPHTKPGSQAPASQRFSGNCQFVLTAPQVVQVGMLGLLPGVPTGFQGRPGADGVLLEWNTNTETDLAGYNLYRSLSPSGPVETPVSAEPITRTRYNDQEVAEGETIYYRLSAVDQAGNESVQTDTLEVVAGLVVVTLPEVAAPGGGGLRVPVGVLNASGLRPDKITLHLAYPEELVALELDGDGNVVGGVEVEQAVWSTGDRRGSLKGSRRTFKLRPT